MHSDFFNLKGFERRKSEVYRNFVTEMMPEIFLTRKKSKIKIKHQLAKPSPDLLANP